MGNDFSAIELKDLSMIRFQIIQVLTVNFTKIKAYMKQGCILILILFFVSMRSRSFQDLTFEKKR